MLSAEENRLITRVGPGTPMGNLLRQYWVPAMLSSELPGPDSDPLRIMLLGEQLIAFRDTSGKVGLLQNQCPHRGASLFFARNEEVGLRCVYHGWKFDTTGQCVDMPNEPAESNFKTKVRAIAYPCVERAGMVWAYLGPRSEPPPLPHLEGNMLPDGESSNTAVQRNCNWLQALEGDIDTCHFSFLHGGALKPEDQQPGTFSYYILKDRAPRYHLVDTDYGAMYGAYRPAAEGQQYWRVAHWLFPFYTMPPQGLLGNKANVRCWVPLDDEHTMFFMCSRRLQPGRQQGGGNDRARRGLQGSGRLTHSADWFGRFQLAANAGNDYQIDRDMQRRGDSYTGIAGIHLQDQAITESMGTIYDRGHEHLGTSDGMVIRVRRRLIAAARALEQDGTIPPGVDEPQAYGVRSGGVYLPDGSDWLEATKDLRKSFLVHEGLDPAITGAIV
ncbi:MAG: Rieske 2Fe-2S domain-containing protein [Chloroflexota bacterium]